MSSVQVLKQEQWLQLCCVVYRLQAIGLQATSYRPMGIGYGLLAVSYVGFVLCRLQCVGYGLSATCYVGCALYRLQATGYRP